MQETPQMLQEFERAAYNRGYRAATRSAENIRSYAPIVFKLLSTALGSLIVITPWAVLFFLYPVVELITQTIIKIIDHAQQSTGGQVTVATIENPEVSDPLR